MGVPAHVWSLAEVHGKQTIVPGNAERLLGIGPMPRQRFGRTLHFVHRI
jgi:hypothetical protein